MVTRREYFIISISYKIFDQKKEIRIIFLNGLIKKINIIVMNCILL